jgi:hypothetical protein
MLATKLCCTEILYKAVEGTKPKIRLNPKSSMIIHISLEKQPSEYRVFAQKLRLRIIFLTYLFGFSSAMHV